jgi:predicted Fe-Mo cluster-binding NifX family protein
MKIAIPSNRPSLEGGVAHKLGTAAYLLVIDTKDMSFEAVDGPPKGSGPGAGVVIMSLAVEMGADALLVGHLAPHILKALEKQGVDVVDRVSGQVSEAVEEYMALRKESDAKGDSLFVKESSSREEWAGATRKAGGQMVTMIPRLVGVILLLGLFRGFVTDDMLFSLFTASPLIDSLLGAALGSILVGNPINSYVIGDSLIHAGIGVAGATALMLAWVSVGIIQFPIESEALGKRFALVRNGAAFVVAAVMGLVLLFLLGTGGR